MDVLPDVPTIGAFVPGYEAAGWVGLGAPANTAPEIIAILNRQVNAALADPTFKARLVDLGEEPFANSPMPGSGQTRPLGRCPLQPDRVNVSQTENPDPSDHRRLLRVRRDRPRGHRAAECGQQLPPSDGDCHTPLPCEVRKWNDSTSRACCPNNAGAGRDALSQCPLHSESGPPANQKFWQYSLRW
jgi:hypothetical protein